MWGLVEAPTAHDYCEAVLLGGAHEDGSRRGLLAQAVQGRHGLFSSGANIERRAPAPQSAHSTYPILQSVSNDLHAALQEQITSVGNDLMLPRQYARLRAARA